MSIQDNLLPAGKRFFIRPGVTDMRKSIGTLASLVENEIGVSPFTVGRKSWLFAGSEAGAKASAGLYTLVQIANLNRWVSSVQRQISL